MLAWCGKFITKYGWGDFLLFGLVYVACSVLAGIYFLLRFVSDGLIVESVALIVAFALVSLIAGVAWVSQPTPDP